MHGKSRCAEYDDKYDVYKFMMKLLGLKVRHVELGNCRFFM